MRPKIRWLTVVLAVLLLLVQADLWLGRGSLPHQWRLEQELAAQRELNAQARGRNEQLAAEVADIAFNHPLTLDIPWTDVWGRRHDTMVGRPVAFHAMRGISAHSNGFHTCRALHILQMLLGAVDTPGSWRYKSPFPRPIPPGGGRRSCRRPSSIPLARRCSTPTSARSSRGG